MLLLLLIPAAMAADEEQIVDLHAGWGHEEGALNLTNVTMVEAYYAFNISGADPDRLVEEELFDIVGIIKQYQKAGVLVNYVICRDGTIICLAENDSKVWHAGKHYNNVSLGIRFVALNATIAQRLSEQEGKKILPGPNDQQYESFAWLVAELKKIYPNIRYVVDYQDIKAEQGIVMPDSEIDWQVVNRHLARRGLEVGYSDSNFL